MLNLKLQYFDYLMQIADSLGKTPMLQKIEDRRRKGWQRRRWFHLVDGDYHWLNGHELEQILGDSEGHDAVYGLQRVRHDLATEQQCIK